ncbi:hypothetical protein LZ32DRAFT_286359 [Colletotrichum eremochloae]|nr:hypothetical protein LZ32DRAFT_286359 [Colletotrichum eremochloae]
MPSRSSQTPSELVVPGGTPPCRSSQPFPDPTLPVYCTRGVRPVIGWSARPRNVPPFPLVTMARG